MSAPHLPDWSPAVDRAAPAVVAVHGRQRIPSSGVYWQEGVIVTAEHTLKRDDDLQATLPDLVTVPVQLVGRDPGTDLAVLRTDARLPVLDRRETPLKIGHPVLALGLSPEDGIGASFGIVSGLGGPWRTWRGGQVDQFLRPDVELYPGFSGGALVDAEGHLLGLNTSALSRSMNLTIPVATVDRVVADILHKGRVARGYLGISMHPIRLGDRLKKALGHDAGVIVLSVEEGSPADHSGVVLGDVLVSVEGRPIQETDDVLALLGPEAIGSELSARLLRGGQPQDVTLKVGERPRS